MFLPYMTPGEYAVINRDWRYIRYGEDGEELYNVRGDPNEWDNLASKPEYEDLKAKLRQFAPRSFAAPERKLHARRDLVVERRFVPLGTRQWQLQTVAEIPALHFSVGRSIPSQLDFRVCL